MISISGVVWLWCRCGVGVEWLWSGCGVGVEWEELGEGWHLWATVHRTTGTNAYRNANIVRHIPEPHLIELRAISLLPDFFHLWPLSTSETISSASIVMYKSYLQNWLSYRIYFFVSATRLNADIRKMYMNIWPLLTLTCGYILVVFLHKYSGSSRKMAYGQLLLNSVLCFLVNKFGKVDVKSLKTALFDSSE